MKGYPHSWIRKLNPVKIANLPKLIYRFNTVCTEKPPWMFAEIDKLILNFIRKCKGARIAYTILKKTDKVGRLILPDFKTYYKAEVIATVWC